MANHFNITNLGDITVFIKDGTHGTHKDVSEGLFLLSAQNIDDGKINIGMNDRKISTNDFNAIHRRYRLQDDDILVSIVGTLGKCAILKDYRDNYTFQRSVAIIRFDTEKILPRFAYYQMLGDSFQGELRKRESKGAQGGVYLGELEKIPFSAPSVETQQKIVAVLDCVTEIIETKKRLLTFKKELTNAFGEKLLSYSKESMQTIRDICDYEQPTHYLVSSIDGSNTPVLTANKTFILGYTDETDGIYSASKKPVVLFDDFTCDCKYVDFDFKIKSSAAKILKPKNNYPAAVLYWIIKSITAQMSGEHKRHYKSELEHKKVPSFSNADLETMNGYFCCCETIMKDAEHEISRLEMAYKYLLNHLINGDLDLSKIQLEEKDKSC